MAKPHKYHRSRIEIETALSPERALDVARQAVQTQRGLTLSDQYESAFSVLIKSVVRLTLLHFTVTAVERGGKTHVFTSIEEYRTSQSTVMFIPVSSKTMEGYGIYRRYMNALASVIQAADPTATYTIIEREAGAA